MPYNINNAEEEVVTGAFTIRTSIFDGNLNVFVTDTNPEVSNHRNKDTGEREACFVSRKFRFNLDNGTPLFKNLCRPEPCPPPCPPDPCRDDERDKEQQEASFAGNHDDDSATSTMVKAEKKPATGNFVLRDEDVLVYGFNPLGGIDRAGFAMLTYHFKIPLQQVAGGFSLLQLYLEDDTGLNTLLLSKGLENTTSAENGAGTKNEIKKWVEEVLHDKVSQEELSKVTNEIAILKKEHDRLSGEIAEVRKEVSQLTGNYKDGQEATQKGSSKGKSS